MKPSTKLLLNVKWQHFEFKIRSMNNSICFYFMLNEFFTGHSSETCSICSRMQSIAKNMFTKTFTVKPANNTSF